VLGHAATDAPALTAQGALALPAAWAAAKPTGAAAGVIIGELAATIDARTPRSVTFDLTTTGKAGSYLVFVAIAASTLDPPALPTAMNTKLRDLALTNPHVAVTTVRLV